LVHQKDDREGHQTDEKDGKDLFEDIEVSGFSHFYDILRERGGDVKKGSEKLDKFILIELI